MTLSGLAWNDSKRIMDELKEYLSYNPETGHFVWIKDYYINKVGSELEAAKAYDNWAKEAHGEYANLNGV